MILDILRFTRGFVSFSVSGRYPERFINITSRNGIRIWDVDRRGDGFEAKMHMSDYMRIRPLARRAGVRLRIKRRSGLPDYISRYRSRVGVVIGACAFIITVFIMSMFVWSIDITGLDTVSLSEMQTLLRERGLYVGAFKPALDFQDIARDIMIEKHEIGWMAVNAAGSYASVEVKEEAPKPEVADIYSPCNIKAKRDGRILSLDTLEGTAEITEGSGVIQGQLLVSGVMGDELGGLRLVHADARAVAETVRTADFSVDESFTVLKPNGESATRRRLDLFGLSVPFVLESVSTPYSVTDSYRLSPAPLGVTLPIGTDVELVYAMEQKDVELDDDSAKELLIRQSELYEAIALCDCKVTAREYLLSRSEDKYILSVTYTCVEDIAYEEPIGTDENTDLTRRPTEPPSEKTP